MKIEGIALQVAIDSAMEAQSELAARLREIADVLGEDVDDLTTILDTCDADSLIEHVRENA